MQADMRLAFTFGSRKKVLDTIKLFYLAKTHENLPIYGVRQKSLGMYFTQDSDVVKGISRMPLNLARIKEEDLVDIEQMFASITKENEFEFPDAENDDADNVDLLN